MFANFNVVILYFYVHLYLWVIVRFWVHKDTPPELLPTREQGFKVQPRRWVVERTFAWVNRNRRLSKEYDLLTTSTENFIYLAMSRVMLKREYA